jgi:putative endonuclease
MINFKKAKAAHLKVGRSGENAACKLLVNKNMEILARNCRYKEGEIDIVARDGHTLVFTEIKTRMKKSGLRPAAGLSNKQKYRIYRAAMKYLKEIENPKVIYRFDLVEIIFPRFGIAEARHWQEHFKGFDTYKNIKKDDF